MEKETIRFRKAVKLILLLQATLEQMDELKGTGVYKRDIKMMINNLEKKIEQFINPHIKQLGMTEEFMMMQIQRGIDEIINKTLEDIHNVGIEEDK